MNGSINYKLKNRRTSKLNYLILTAPWHHNLSQDLKAMKMAMISGTSYSKLITGFNLQKSAMNNSKVTSPKKLTSP